MPDQYLMYIFFAMGYIASPGPAVLISINQGATKGVKKTLPILLGNTTGIGVLAIISSLGIGAIIISNPTLNNIIKIMGNIWIFYLGFKMLTKKNISENMDKKITKNRLGEYKDGVILALTNPKPIIFFLSIFPQFINNNNNSFQLLLLSFTFLVLSFSILTAYALISSLTFGNFLTHKRLTVFNKTFGLGFILLSVYLMYSILA